MHFISLLYVIFAIGQMHPSHYSVTTIDYYSAEKKMNIFVRLQSEDLEYIVSHKYNCSLRLDNQTDKEESDKSIKKCIFDYLQIKTDNKNLKIKNVILQKKEMIDDHEVILSFEICNVKSFSNLEIENCIFFDLYPDQKNLVIITNNDKQFSDTFTILKKIIKFNF